MTTKTDILRIKLETTGDGKVKASLAGMESGMQGVERQTKQTSATLSKYKSLLAAVSITAGVVYARAELQALDALQSKADMLGLTTTKLQEYRAAAASVNIEQGTLDTAMQRFIRRVGEAAQGNGELKDTLADMNIELREADGTLRPIDDILGDFANGLAQSDSHAERLAATMKAFDSEGVVMVNLLGEGAGKLQRLREEARQTGEIIDAQLVQQAADANTELERMERILDAQLSIAIASVAPQIESLAFFLSTVAKGIGKTFDTLPKSEFQQLDGLLDDLLTRYRDLQEQLEFNQQFDEYLPINGDSIQQQKDELAGLSIAIDSVNQALLDLHQTQQKATQGGEIDQGNPYAKDANFEERFQRLQGQIDPATAELERFKNEVIDLYIAWNEGDISTERFTELTNKLAESRDMAPQWAEAWEHSFNTFAVGVGNAVGNAIVYADNLREGLMNVLRVVIQQVIAGLVTIGIKKAVLATQETSTLAAQTAVSAGMGSALAAAWAPAAAMTSLAMAGANSIPAQSGIATTVSLSQGLALAGVAHSGLDDVPTDGTYLLQGGEMVLNKGNAEAMRDILKDGGAGGATQVNVNFHINAVDAAGVDRVIASRRGMIENIAINALNKAAYQRGRRLY